MAMPAVFSAYCQTFHIFIVIIIIFFFSFEFQSIWCFIIILQRAIFAISFFIAFYFSIFSHSTCPGNERWLFNFSRRLSNDFTPNDRWMIDAIPFYYGFMAKSIRLFSLISLSKMPISLCEMCKWYHWSMTRTIKSNIPHSIYSLLVPHWIAMMQTANIKHHVLSLMGRHSSHSCGIQRIQCTWVTSAICMAFNIVCLMMDCH